MRAMGEPGATRSISPCAQRARVVASELRPLEIEKVTIGGGEAISSTVHDLVQGVGCGTLRACATAVGAGRITGRSDQV